MFASLYEDNHLLIVNKPAGYLTQSDVTGDASLVEIGKQYLKEKYHKPGKVFLIPVHRLDRPVSGALMFARTSKAASRLTALFRERTGVEKIYLAIIDGILPAPSACWQDRLLIGNQQNKTRIAAATVAVAKKAVLLYQVLEANKRQSLVAIKLLTGYKHQIRVQFAARGVPIAGDFKYAPPIKNEKKTWTDARAIALHSFRLSFLHPTKKEMLAIIAPPPDYFAKWRTAITAARDCQFPSMDGSD